MTHALAVSADPADRTPWSTLVDAIEKLSAARSLEGVIEIVRSAARHISGADGVTFVLRDEDRCHYVDENAIGPLWKGQKFPMSACISGWVMLNREVAVIPDIYVDPRIPHDAYRPTFVKSLVMVPVRVEDPLAAIGAYWARNYRPGDAEIELLCSLARATATAIANISLQASLRDAAERASAQAAEIKRLYDAAQRQAAERLQVERQLAQAQKMEAVGQLTGGLAHDFNNLLGVVIGNLDLLEERLGDDAANRSLLAAAIDGCLRGADLTRRLLAFARQQPLAASRADPAGVLKGLVELLERTLGGAIMLRLRTAEGLWPVMVDRSQLEAAVLNLAVNARDAMPSGGTLAIELGNARLTADYVDLNPEAVPGDYVEIAVSDTGSGMPPEVVARAFEPFFTTKEPGRGTGLGLSMVYGFIKQSSGHVKIYSEPGRGTTIKLWLPRAPEAALTDGAEASAAEVLPGGSEAILVVDDNAEIRKVVLRHMAALGYRTCEAKDAGAALDLLRSDTPVDLLFTDVVMPGGMDGRALAAEAARLRPGIRTLLTSGFTQANAVGEIGLAIPLLSKPYRRQQLAHALRAALDQA